MLPAQTLTKEAQTIKKAVIKYPRVNELSAKRPKNLPMETEIGGRWVKVVKESKQINKTMAKEIKIRASNSNFLIFLIFMSLPLIMISWDCLI
jgi:hypothetical protein